MLPSFARAAARLLAPENTGVLRAALCAIVVAAAGAAQAVPIVVDPGPITVGYRIPSTPLYNVSGLQQAEVAPGAYSFFVGATFVNFTVAADGSVSGPANETLDFVGNTIRFRPGVVLRIEPGDVDVGYRIPSTAIYNVSGPQSELFPAGVRLDICIHATCISFDTHANGTVTGALNRSVEFTGDTIAFHDAIVVNFAPADQSVGYRVPSTPVYNVSGNHSARLVPGTVMELCVLSSCPTFIVGDSCDTSLSPAGYLFALTCGADADDDGVADDDDVCPFDPGNDDDAADGADGLVARWSFDGADPALLLGQSDGPDAADPSFGDGVDGGGLHVGGATYAHVADDAALEPAQVTISTWIKASGIPGGYLITKGGHDCMASTWALTSAGGDTIAFYVGSAEHQHVIAPIGIGPWDGTWHHLAGTYDGAFVRLFIDGVEVGTGTAFSGGLTYGLTPNDELTIGAYRGSCFYPWGESDLDDVRLYDRALSSAEVATLADTAQFLGDGVCAAVDNCPDTFNADQSDVDLDGVGDACDIVSDADDDGVADDDDGCPGVFDPGQVDTDGDELGDLCDDDDDGDGLLDGSDNCPFDGNAGQADLDSDGAGDPCDLDDDGDGTLDDVDLCPGTADDQRDNDDDALGNACDDDDDDDGLPDLADNCALVENTLQLDVDRDGVGDDCDDDDDSDGVFDENDNCPTTGNAQQQDNDNDGVGDDCDDDDDGDGIADAGDFCPLSLALAADDVDHNGCRDLVVDVAPFIRGMGLPQGVQQSLVSKAKAAERALDGPQPEQAIEKLNQLIDEVQRLRSKGHLSNAIADLLLAFARSALRSLA